MNAVDAALPHAEDTHHRIVDRICDKMMSPNVSSPGKVSKDKRSETLWGLDDRLFSKNAFLSISICIEKRKRINCYS